MSLRLARVAAACVLMRCALGAPLWAQTRFTVLAQHDMNDVAGLRIVTIRDTQLSSCYTLFVMQSVATPPPSTEGIAVETPPTDESTRQAVQRIRDAAERRDNALRELMSTVRKRSAIGLFEEERARLEFEQERRRIEEEYERVLRTEIPGSSPWATTVPGMQSGGYEDLANATRRAVVDPDPTSSMKTVADQLARLEGLLRRLIEEPRLAVSGPVACDAAAAGVATIRPQ